MLVAAARTCRRSISIASRSQPRVLDLVPGELAEQHSLVPFAQPMKFLDVAMTEPTNLGLHRRAAHPHAAQHPPVPRRPQDDRARAREALPARLQGPRSRRGRGHVRRARRPARRHHRADRSDRYRGAAAARGHPVAAAARPQAADRRARAGSGVIALRDRDLVAPHPRDAEIDALQHRISTLEALVERDEEVLRKLLALLVEKGVATREEILERIR